MQVILAFEQPVRYSGYVSCDGVQDFIHLHRVDASLVVARVSLFNQCLKLLDLTSFFGDGNTELFPHLWLRATNILREIFHFISGSISFCSFLQLLVSINHCGNQLAKLLLDFLQLFNYAVVGAIFGRVLRPVRATLSVG